MAGTVAEGFKQPVEVISLLISGWERQIKLEELNEKGLLDGETEK